MGASEIPLEERRTLAAIIPYPGVAFFLKAVDRIERLNPVESDFRTVVERFSVDPATGTPNMSLPAGWQFKMRETDNDFVMADFFVDTGASAPIKFTVSVLGYSNWDADLLKNVDRWRDQMGLPPTDLETLKKELPAIARDSSPNPAYIFDATAAGVGPQSRKNVPLPSADNAPTEPMPPPNAPPATNEPSAVAQPQEKEPLKITAYTKPDSWTLQEPKPIRLMSFGVTKEDRTAEVVVSWVKDDPISNASMWYQQVLKTEDKSIVDPLAAKSIADAEEIPAGDVTGKLYSIRASDDASASTLLVAAIPTGKDNMCLFVKLKCDLRMAEEEKANLLSFVNSLRWEQE